MPDIHPWALPWRNKSKLSEIYDVNGETYFPSTKPFGWITVVHIMLPGVILKCWGLFLNTRSISQV